MSAESLEREILEQSAKVDTDGYDMSLGEIMNLYSNKELVIAPEFQRLFRWTLQQKSKLIESILLGIPLPPIFVFQRADGIWELVDGLQRLSTVFEFFGKLVGTEGHLLPASTLIGTKRLPSLEGKRSSGPPKVSIPAPRAIAIKRARLRVEILKQSSDPNIKFELFQRLNTLGSPLTQQEIRNCLIIMKNKNFYRQLVQLAENSDFRATCDLTENAKEKQGEIELIVRYFVYKMIAYNTELDVHEYLDDGILDLAGQGLLDEDEIITFNRTFKFLHDALGDSAFTRWNGSKFAGKFLISVFEVVAIGLAANISRFDSMSSEERNDKIREISQRLWSNRLFLEHSGAGVRGTTRIKNLLHLGPEVFAES